MSFKKRISIFLISVCLLITACSSAFPKSNPNASFQNFTLNLFQSEVCSSTINLRYSLKNPEQYGIQHFPITFGSFDVDELTQYTYLENLTCALENFSYKNLSTQNKLTYDVLSYYLDLAQDGVSFSLYEEPLSPITGIHSQLPILLAEYPFYSQEDIDTYLSLLKTLPEYFDSLIKFEEQKAAAGLFMSDSVADEVIAQCNAFAELGTDNYLITTFEERVSNFESEKYISQNKKIVQDVVLPAYQRLADSLSKLKGSGKNDLGLSHLDRGKEYYSYLVRSETGSARTVEELKVLIQSQITDDILALQNVLSQNPSVLQENCSIQQTPEEILLSLESQITSSFPKADDVHIVIKQVPKAMEDYLSPAFYLIPPIDDYSQNTIYINNVYSPEDISLFTTLAHEGYPGHLYQTTYYASTNPDPIRTWLNFKGYVEGWATYAEMCSFFISPLDQSLATLLQKNNSAMLGLYAMADIGIHYDGWDMEDAKEFFSSYGIEDSSVVEEIYKLILGDPANYLSYYVGYVEILELKKEYTGRQIDFHKELLEVGPAPFEIIKDYL